tara:strand:+ start:308 stop:502 length:195 start_codon:yes stop_codon:yes gene_type:complete
MVTKKEVNRELKDIKKKLNLLKKEIDTEIALVPTSGKKLNQGCNEILEIFDQMIKGKFKKEKPK